MDTTLQDPLDAPSATARPGLVVLWSANTPLCVPHELRDAKLTIGRDAENDLSFQNDGYLSRSHGSIAFLAGGWMVEAAKTAFLDGVPFDGRKSLDAPALLRFGRTILLLTRDVTRFELPTIVDGYVQSRALRDVFDEAAQASQDGRTLLILAPTGAGKEAIARAFHERGPRAKGPFVILDSPSIRGDTAVARLFGSRRGAFTGATDSEGLLASAAGGTVFVDELGDMDLEVQASVLRAFQERTVVPVGGTTPRKIDFALAAATHVDLERATEDGRFRADLLGRLEQRVVILEGLEQRRDEIPFLVELFAKRHRPDVAIDASFVEACMLRAWPRNVRQLESVVENAAHRASRAGRAVVASDVPPSGQRASVPPAEARAVPAEATPDDEERRAFMAAYRAANGDPDEAMKALGIKRAAFYARKKKYGVR